MAVPFFRSKSAPPPETDDSLQISGAIVAPRTDPPLSSWSTPATPPTGWASCGTSTSARSASPPRSGWSRARMMVEGRRLRFAVSDNVDAHGPDGPGSPPIWAVNIHGYFAGGGMYWRESARLAEQLGWRVINPSLPGFGGSDPLEWHDVSMESLANQIMAIAHKVDAGPAVLLGHSMGGAVAVQFAHDHPRRTLGVIYRDGVSTPAWKERHGIIPTLLSPFAARHRAHGRHDRRRRVRPARPRHRADVLDRACRAARHAPEHPHDVPDTARRQHAHGRGPAQRGAPPGGPADADPQRVGLLRPHHARAARHWSSPPSPARRCCGCRGATAGCWPVPRARPTSSPTSPGARSSWHRWRPLAAVHPASTRCAPSTDDRAP